MSWKVISVRPEQKDEANDVLKHNSPSNYMTLISPAMSHNYLKTQGQNMMVTQFHVECVSMPGSHMK